jgi:hypothetical protein
VTDTLVAIDPGVRRCGISLWEEGKLRNAWLTKERDTWSEVAGDVGAWTGKAVIEFPQFYSRRALGKGDPNDLLNLAAVVGAITTHYLYPVIVRPREWKGQAPKDVTEARVRKELSKVEMARVDLPAKSLRHNVFDAIGIGLWFLKKKGMR